MLEGKTVNLRLMEKEDIPLFLEWINNPDFFGEYNPLEQDTKAEMEKTFENASTDRKKLFVEKKDGTKIGVVNTCLGPSSLEIGFTLISKYRGKGFGTEAVQILIDYLFLARDLIRIQAHADIRNVASQKLLGKIGFKKEGVERKSMFIHGEWRNLALYSILREEWKEPKILTKTK